MSKNEINWNISNTCLFCGNEKKSGYEDYHKYF